MVNRIDGNHVDNVANKTCCCFQFWRKTKKDNVIDIEKKLLPTPPNNNNDGDMLLEFNQSININ